VHPDLCEPVDRHLGAVTDALAERDVALLGRWRRHGRHLGVDLGELGGEEGAGVFHTLRMRPPC
jgi:hypothetical protein